jgi:hypothetical protein
MRIKRPKVVDRASYEYGLRIAAAVASDYDRTNSHPFLVSDCILGKLNLLRGRPRKNEKSRSLEQVLAGIERRLEAIEAEVRFGTRHTNFKRSTAGVRL